MSMKSFVVFSIIILLQIFPSVRAVETNETSGPAKECRAFDFGVENSPVFPGFVQVTEKTVYTRARGFGWIPRKKGAPVPESDYGAGGQNVPGLKSADRGRSIMAIGSLYCDFCCAFSNAQAQVEQEFAVDLPKGIYRARLYSGDVSLSGDGGDRPFSIHAEGAPVAEQVSLGLGQCGWVDFDVTVNDGQANIIMTDTKGYAPWPARDGQLSYGWRINGLILCPANTDKEKTLAAAELSRIDAQIKDERAAQFAAIFKNPAHTALLKTPFYEDKLNLLMYIDSAGQKHPVTNVTEWQKRREHILANMQLIMGPLPTADKKVPLDIQVINSETLPKVTRKKITYGSEEGHRVIAYLIIPNGLKGKAPAMLCLHGSSGARGRIAGLGEDYPRFALELAERGYVTIAPDYVYMGEKDRNPYEMGYVSGTMKGIWDHMRAVDLLQSLPEVDGERIGCIGNSLGGHNSLYAAAFDQRLKVAVTSVGFDSIFDYMGGKPGALRGWTQPCYMPLALSMYGLDPKKMPFDFPEVLGALAPRYLFVQAPIGDSNFKVESVKKCIAAAAPVYKLFGAEDRVMAIYPEGGHGFPPADREAAYKFIDKALEHNAR